VIDETDNIDDDMNNSVGHCRSLSMIKSSSLVVFKNFFERFYQQRENTSSNRSDEIDDCQDKR